MIIKGALVAMLIKLSATIISSVFHSSNTAQKVSSTVQYLNQRQDTPACAIGDC